MAILAAEWRGVLGSTWNSKISLVFSHVVLMKALRVFRARAILARITRRMDLWERGFHADLVGDTEAEGSAREIRASSRGEYEDKDVSRSYHDTVFSGKLIQDIC